MKSIVPYNAVTSSTLSGISLHLHKVFLNKTERILGYMVLKKSYFMMLF